MEDKSVGFIDFFRNIPDHRILKGTSINSSFVVPAQAGTLKNQGPRCPPSRA